MLIALYWTPLAIGLEGIRQAHRSAGYGGAIVSCRQTATHEADCQDEPSANFHTPPGFAGLAAPRPLPHPPGQTEGAPRCMAAPLALTG